MKLLLISLGCDKNLVDSEVMLSLLRGAGFTFTDDEAEAEVIVVNTCSFINDAKEESIQTILEMAEYRKEGSCLALIVTGCLAQRYREEIQEEIPEVDAILGTTAIEQVAEAALEIIEGQKGHVRRLEETDKAPYLSDGRIVTTGGHYAYLKIAEGCDKHCTYCIIPQLRGRYRSLPMEHLLKEAAGLAADGVKELILVAQETTLYGVDLYGEKKLPRLLRSLCEIEGLHWIRLLYCYPEEITDELITVIKEEPKICHYLDMPIQHANDDILKRMGRRTDRAQLLSIIRHIREEIPDICLRTTLITGFPGETEEMHEELMDFIDEVGFDRLGVFPYSPEEGTPAAEMADQIGQEEKERRRDELMALQQEISREKGEESVGAVLDAFVEGRLADEEAYVARTYRDAPGVDGYVFIETGRELMTGEFVQVRITGADEYDLMGGIADESAQ